MPPSLFFGCFIPAGQATPFSAQRGSCNRLSSPRGLATVHLAELRGLAAVSSRAVVTALLSPLLDEPAGGSVRLECAVDQVAARAETSE